MGSDAVNGQAIHDSAGLLGDYCECVAEDLVQLATLHHAEADTALIRSLKQSAFPLSLGMKLQSEFGREALLLMEKALTGLPDPLDEHEGDELAADFAGIYLTHAYRASPNESVWVDEEHLARQQSMFEVRAYYARYGLRAANWRERADDHLVLQLQFLAHLFGLEHPEGVLCTVTRFMDEHLLRWLMPFAERVAERCSTPFYAGINLLTAIYCEELRDLLAEILETPRPAPKEIEARMQRAGMDRTPAIPMQFVPGAAGPSW